MALSLHRHPTFAPRSGPVLVLVADGVGVAPPDPSNAVHAAYTPTLDGLAAGDLYTELAAHGEAVGLPSNEDMGNSEVGHNALGAGRIFDQGAKLVNRSLADHSLYSSKVWTDLVARAKKGTFHFLGLHSDGNVHSHVDHLHQLLRRAAADGVSSVCLHLLADGRDVAARSALSYVAQTEAVLAEINDQHASNFRIASGGGRMAITMDRYEADWPMVKRGYDCHTHGIGRTFVSATEAIETMYRETDDGDQYLAEYVIVGQDGEPVGPMVDGDAVLLFNFRGDRAIEISQAYEKADFAAFDRGAHPDVLYAGMLQYDGDLQVPERYLVDPPAIDRTMGEYLCAEGVSSFAVSETQKFGHVTYFWNGNRSGYIDAELETYVEIPSDNVEFNKTPGMKVREITTETIRLLESGTFAFGRINFPNGDMVGHTGDLQATVEAMEVVEECVQRLMAAVEALDGVLIYTADHGNADIMYTESDGVRSPKTSHTRSPVPFAIYDPGYSGEYRLDPPVDAGLSHVAATVLNLMGYEAPEGYQPSLIVFDG